MNSLIIKLQDRLNGLFPGLIVVGTIAAAAGFLSLHYKAPVMLFALMLTESPRPSTWSWQFLMVYNAIALRTFKEERGMSHMIEEIIVK